MLFTHIDSIYTHAHTAIIDWRPANIPTYVPNQALQPRHTLEIRCR